MEIIVARNSGFCYGVRRAMQMALQTRRRTEGPVLTLGELIHNPRTIADLEARGVHSVEHPESISGGTVIIRSHGVAPDVYRLLKNKRVQVVDATCPIVKKIQDLVARLAKSGEDVIIVGDPRHPEIKGLLGYSRGRGRVIENEAQAGKLPQKKRRAVLAQSTQDVFRFGRVVAVLIEKTEELRVYNTICRFTRSRQKSTSDLASRVDTLFVVGGKKSSNTAQLYQISKRVLANTHLIENASEITPQLLRGSKRIGISGGASTPPEAISEAVAKIQRCIEHYSQRETTVQWQS